MADQQQNRDFGIELTEQERRKCDEKARVLGGRILTTALTHPLALARTLIQLGHEPYPITRGKAFYFFGKERNYLPNMLSYLDNIYHSHGFLALYAGFPAHLVMDIAESVGSFAVSLYLDRYAPDIGGGRELTTALDENAKIELQNFPAFRLKMRGAIRDTISALCGMVVMRPFAVIMIRQIAQHIGQETKYSPFNILQPLMRIGHEEGLQGLYSGIVPSAIYVVSTVWLSAAISYGIDIAYKHLENELDDDEQKQQLTKMRKMTYYIMPLAITRFRYPLDVVSTVMAVAGSGLLASVFPYTTCSHWSDVYDYLKPYEIYRGASTIWREQKSTIRIGADHQRFASKNFI